MGVGCAAGDVALSDSDIDYPSRLARRLVSSLPALGPLLRLSLRHPLASLQLLRAFLPG
jgi:hypothetical protein